MPATYRNSTVKPSYLVLVHATYMVVLVFQDQISFKCLLPSGGIYQYYNPF